MSLRDPWSSVIKPGPARRVDPGPGPVRTAQKTGARKKPARPDLTRVTRPDPGDPTGLYILTHLGKIGKAKGKLNFYPNFFLCSSKFEQSNYILLLVSSTGCSVGFLFFFSLNILAPPFTGSCHHLVESCSLHQWSETKEKPDSTARYFIFLQYYSC